MKKGNKLSFYSELRRRNVFKVGIVYFAVAWLLLQVSDTLGPALHLPEWFVSAVAFLLILGFPAALVFAWAFDLTPEGLKREDPAAPIAGKTGRKLNHIIVAALVIALSYFVFERVVLDSDRETAGTSTAVQVAQQQPAEIESVGVDNSIAVLPFVNMSSDEEQEYFSDGLSEELLNLLAGIPELNVAARTSSFSFKGKDIGIPEIASQLNVAHVLEGSVRKHGNQLRIDNGYHIWSETYDRQLDNVFQIQEDIAIAVVDALRITLLGEVPKTRKTDPRAYQLFLEGHYLKRQISSEWAELADTYLWGGGLDELSHEETSALADQAIQTAISTDPDYAFTYYVRGIWWIFAKNKFKQGIEDFEHALELDPDDAFIVAAIGKGAVLTGQFDLAISQYQAALAMEPVVPEFYFYLGRAYLSSGRLDEAEETFRTLSSLSPSYRGELHLWETLLLKGELEAALAASDTTFKRAIVHHALGDTAKADVYLAELIENANPYTIASAYGYGGEVDKTFEWLGNSLENSDYFPTFVLAETAFRSIHSDKRWPLFLEKLGLLEYWLEMTPD
jgi:TolB-like protein/Tfp pilus assembly protein PilF